MKTKLKTHVLTVSRVFPSTHKRKGEETFFPERILLKQGCPDCDEVQDLTGENISKCNSCQRWIYGSGKIHTIRANYEHWSKRIKEVQEGKAILSVRYWADKPYHKDKNGIGQVEICQLDKDSRIGFEKIFFNFADINYPIVDNGLKSFFVDVEELAKNDGLSIEDFKEWFKGYDLSAPMALIHFTPFRY